MKVQCLNCRPQRKVAYNPKMTFIFVADKVPDATGYKVLQPRALCQKHSRERTAMKRKVGSPWRVPKAIQKESEIETD